MNISARQVMTDVPTEPVGLDSEFVVVRYNSSKLNERAKIIDRKPRAALSLAPIDDLQGIHGAWAQSPHRAVSMPRAQRETAQEQARPFAAGMWANLAVATALVAGAAAVVMVL